jgi:hypothetical protein
MNTTAKERHEVIARLEKLGIDYQTAQQLRRIALTLQRWFELECGTGDEHVTLSVEREGENGEGKPFMRRQYQGPNGWIDNRYPIPDRETGARKRLARIMADFPKLTYYVQTDPRGCALYILRKSDLCDLPIDQAYTRGLAVY